LSNCESTYAQREVPGFSAVNYRDKASEYCVCVFVINENGRLHTQVRRMQPYADVLDIVIADGGSTDGSTEREHLEPFGVNTLLVKTGSGKLGAQMRMAFSWALDRGYKGVVTIDGNNKDDPEALTAFVEKLRSGFDHVQGSRFMVGGVSENLPIFRWFATKFVHIPMIRMASGFRYTDTTNGFRAYSDKFLSDPRVAVFRNEFVGYELHYYLAIRAAKLGFKVTEVPVARRYPAAGPAPTKIGFVRGNLSVLRCLVAASFGALDP
jgi:dolichol-phosphate mannosyltransferase